MLKAKTISLSGVYSAPTNPLAPVSCGGCLLCCQLILQERGILQHWHLLEEYGDLYIFFLSNIFL